MEVSNALSYGNATVVISGPLVLPSCIAVSSPFNTLFEVGPGQSTGPTRAFGSNTIYQVSTLEAILGLWCRPVQNNGAGGQFGDDIAYEISLFNAGFLVDRLIATV